MRLKSGKCDMGTVGATTGLFDSLGHPLYVGDIVAVWTTNKENGYNDSPEYVVQSPVLNEGKPFIMGLMKAIMVREYYCDGEMVEKEDAEDILDTYKDMDTGTEWVIHKIKDNLNVVPGETWDGVKATYVVEK